MHSRLNWRLVLTSLVIDAFWILPRLHLFVFRNVAQKSASKANFTFSRASKGVKFMKNIPIILLAAEFFRVRTSSFLSTIYFFENVAQARTLFHLFIVHVMLFCLVYWMKTVLFDPFRFYQATIFVYNFSFFRRFVCKNQFIHCVVQINTLIKFRSFMARLHSKQPKFNECSLQWQHSPCLTNFLK